MSAVISWNLQLALNEGRLDDFTKLMHEMVESTQTEPGALIYEWFLSEDNTTCHLYERYANSDAVMAHLGTFGAKFASRFVECVTPTAMHVYGEPTDDVRGALKGLGSSHFGAFGGFAR